MLLQWLLAKSPTETSKNNCGNLVAILVAIVKNLHQKTPHGVNHKVL